MIIQFYHFNKATTDGDCNETKQFLLHTYINSHRLFLIVQNRSVECFACSRFTMLCWFAFLSFCFFFCDSFQPKLLASSILYMILVSACGANKKHLCALVLFLCHHGKLQQFHWVCEQRQYLIAYVTNVIRFRMPNTRFICN